MIYAVIFILIIMNWINKAIGMLEHQQRILCYDMQILSKKISEDESQIW